MSGAKLSGNSQLVRALAALLLVFLPFCAGSFSFAVAAEQANGENSSITDVSRRHYVGVRKCRLCHDRRPQEKGDTLLDDSLVLTDFVSLTEFHTWFQKDKHSKAYRALTEPRGRQIGTVLGINPSRDTRCISCHGTLYSGKLPPPTDLRLGVTCEGCHGAASGWLLAHSEPQWRGKSPEAKRRAGMIDLRDMDTRAQLCFSCHIGNAREQKIVTHEMYAAGHPLLPEVEIETHLRAMPAHWTDLGEKPAQIRISLGHDPKLLYRTKSVVLGGLLAFREWIEMMVARSPPTGDSVWPDFSIYDCSGCHHDINLRSWRQERGFRGVAGRPHFPDWPRALVKLAIFHSSGRNSQAFTEKYKQFSEKFDSLSTVFNPKGFSDRAGSMQRQAREAAANDLLVWLNKLAADIEIRSLDRAAAAQLLRRLAVLKEPEDPAYMALPDFATARQTVQALVSIAKELPMNEKKKELAGVILQLQNAVGLAETGRQRAEAAYDPQRFRDQISRLARLLEP